MTTLLDIIPWWGAHVVSTYSIGDFQAKDDGSTQSLNDQEDQLLTQSIANLAKS